MRLRRAPDVARPTVERPPCDVLEAREYRRLRDEVTRGDERRTVDPCREGLDRIERDVREHDIGSGQRIAWTDQPRVELDAVRSRVGARRLDRRGLYIDRHDRREPEQAGCDREHARAAADIEERLRREVLQRCETKLLRLVRAGPLRTPGIDHDYERVLVDRFPRWTDPETTDANRLVERSPPVLPPILDVGGAPVAEERPHALFAGGVRIGDQFDALRTVDLFEAFGEELDHGRARLFSTLVPD